MKNDEIKTQVKTEIDERVNLGITEKATAEFLKKIIDKAEGLTEINLIQQLGDYFKKTGFHFNREVEKEINTDNICYFKKNDSLSFIQNKDDTDNLLVIGDNYKALLNLLICYKNKIKMIYIDPPYGKDSMGEFADVNYDNSLTRDDLLSMLDLRLRLAKLLLTEDGVIFCSIDDKNQAYVKCLFDEIFGERNFVSSQFVLDNLKGKTNDNFITSVGSKMLIYAKNKSILNEIGFNEVENIFAEKVEDKYKNEDSEGLFNLITFTKTGQSKLREDRPLMFYPILERDGYLYSITKEEFENLYDRKSKKFNDNYLITLKSKYNSYNFILPLSEKNEYLRWTSGYDNFCKNINKEIVFYNNKIMQKNRPDYKELLQIYSSGTPKSFFYKPSYSNGTLELISIFNKNIFDFPKSVELIKDIIKLYKSNDIIVLDFFAGSGTTGQAVLEQNKEDGGRRKFILVQYPESLKEGSIQETFCKQENLPLKLSSICYERLKRVMTGTSSSGESFKWSENNTKLGGNLTVVELAEVSKYENDEGKTAFDLIDETLYGLNKFTNINDKIAFVCENFENTLKGTEKDGKQ